MWAGLVSSGTVVPGMSCKVPAAMIRNKLNESLALAQAGTQHLGPYCLFIMIRLNLVKSAIFQK